MRIPSIQYVSSGLSFWNLMLQKSGQHNTILFDCIERERERATTTKFGRDTVELEQNKVATKKRE